MDIRTIRKERSVEISNILECPNTLIKSREQSTPVKGITFRVTNRYMGGRKLKRYVFHVKLLEGSVDIPILKMGWKKAWKKAVLISSSQVGINKKRNTIRQMSRAPRLDSFLLKTSEEALLDA